MSAPLSRSVFTERLRGLKNAKRDLYFIEEPTIGLHMADVKHLIDILHRLFDEGHTVGVIEHHPDVFAEPTTSSTSAPKPVPKAATSSPKAPPNKSPPTKPAAPPRS